jgi:hypothetical protein
VPLCGLSISALSTVTVSSNQQTPCNRELMLVITIGCICNIISLKRLISSFTHKLQSFHLHQIAFVGSLSLKRINGNLKPYDFNALFYFIIIINCYRIKSFLECAHIYSLRDIGLRWFYLLSINCMTIYICNYEH